MPDSRDPAQHAESRLTGCAGEVIENDISLDDLLVGDAAFLSSSLATLAHHPARLESLLRQLNFRRHRGRTLAETDRLLEFLAAAYDITRDIRYLNELLFIDSSPAEPRVQHAQRIFAELTSGNRPHTFPCATVQEVATYVADRSRARNALLNEILVKTVARRIGLVGFPSLFATLDPDLRERGHEVGVFHVPWHSEPLRRFVSKSRLLTRSHALLKRARLPFTWLEYDPTNEHAGRVIQEYRPELGFHKLGFIVRRPIFEAFSIGLMNDHWAVLPYVRGRSTIAWSFLLGFPLCATLHYIDSGVDSGDIVAVYEYNMPADARSVGDAEAIIKAHASSRILDSFILHDHPRFEIVENPVQLGQQFYSIHPILKAHADEMVRLRAESTLKSES